MYRMCFLVKKKDIGDFIAKFSREYKPPTSIEADFDGCPESYTIIHVNILIESKDALDEISQTIGYRGFLMPI